MSDASTPAGILRAVERWASAEESRKRRSGFFGKAAPHRGDGWGLSVSDGDVVAVCRAGGRTWFVSPPIALAFCILLESEAEPVDVGRCRACVGTGRDVASVACEIAGRDVVTLAGRRPCPACTGTGREIIPAERLLLDAVRGDAGTSIDYVVGGDDHFAAGWAAHNESDRHIVVREQCPPHPDGRERFRLRRIRPGDPNARDVIAAHADQLQAVGDPLGSLLAWALWLWQCEPVDCGACRLCDRRAEQEDHARSLGGLLEWPTACPACSGTGRQLGHPHTAEAVAWLEWLTDVRDEPRDVGTSRARPSPPVRP